MVGEILSGLGAFKSMLDAAKSLKDMNDTAIRNAAVIDLSQKIIDAQQEQMALMEQMRTLEGEMARLRTWDTEKQRYELKSLGEGVFGYGVKADAQGNDPPHSICPDCYHGGAKSILQQVTRHPGICYVLLCQKCGWEAYTVEGWHPEHGGKSGSRRRS